MTQPPPVVPAPPPVAAAPVKAPAAPAPRKPPIVGRPDRPIPPAPLLAAGAGGIGLAATVGALFAGPVGAVGAVVGLAGAGAAGVATHRRLQRDPSKPRPPRTRPRFGRTPRAQGGPNAAVRRSPSPRGTPHGGPTAGPTSPTGWGRLLPGGARRRTASAGAGPGRAGAAGEPKSPGSRRANADRRFPGLHRRRPTGQAGGSTPGGGALPSSPAGRPNRQGQPNRPRRTWRHPIRGATPPPSGRTPRQQPAPGTPATPGGRTRRTGRHSPAGGGNGGAGGNTPRRRFRRQPATPNPTAPAATTGGTTRRPRPASGNSRATQARTAQQDGTTRSRTAALIARRRAARAKRLGRTDTAGTGWQTGRGPFPVASTKWDRETPATGRKARKTAAGKTAPAPDPADAAPPKPAGRPKRVEQPWGSRAPAERGPDPVGDWLIAEARDHRAAKARPAKPAAPAAATRPDPPARRPTRRADLGDSQWTPQPTGRTRPAVTAPIESMGGGMFAHIARIKAANEQHAATMRAAADAVDDTPASAAFRDVARAIADQASAVAAQCDDLEGTYRQADQVGHDYRDRYAGRDPQNLWGTPD